MPVRVLESDVTDLIENLSCDVNIQSFIELANILTDKVSSCATTRGEPLDATCLEAIERLLAAHMYSLRIAQLTAKKTGDASASFMRRGGIGLDGSQYGQMAKLFDTSGCLEDLDKPKARLTWLGKPESEQIPYEQRD